ncbi:subtilisin-like protein, partial [Anaeromyces robustus]
TNFYYPKSAGKNIDIYLIDQGLIVNHEDYNNTDERTITCDAIAYDDDHGILVASLAGGNIYGVSKKANLHMIAVDFSVVGILRALDYILEHGEPHKTVISISIRGYSYYESEEKKLNDLINKGFIIFVAAGNEHSNCCGDKNSRDFYSFAGYRKAITVGAAEIGIYNYGFTKASYSNYGDCIDIFGPVPVKYPDLSNGSTLENKENGGTSSATPIVAGVAASIMS